MEEKLARLSLLPDMLKLISSDGDDAPDVSTDFGETSDNVGGDEDGDDE